MRTAIREYYGKNVNLDKLGQLIVEFFNEEHFKTQTAKHPNGIIIQAKKGGVFRTILAMDRAFTIIIEGDQSDFKVKIGVSAWLMDLGIAAIETFFIAGALAFIEVPEALWSYEIEHQLWHYVENQVELGIQ
ncbi:MAG: hypothetical protein QW597_05160 [Thermoplasmataceae archaeon]